MELIGWKQKSQEGFRYYYENNAFSIGSAQVLHYMLRILKPNKVIEVGSGFSTAVMLDTNEKCLENKTEIIAIEPYADRLRSVLTERDNLKLFECNLQEIPLSFFEQLEEGDTLFIDSSHVLRIDSDVNIPYSFLESL